MSVSPITFGRVKTPCGDCWDGHCTMNCSPRETIPDEPTRCACMTAANNQLKSHNTKLAVSFIFTRDLSGGMDVLPMIAVEKIDPRKRGKVMNVVPTFCPFCGTKYPRKGEEGEGLPEAIR
jgi:hypothetical protein